MEDQHVTKILLLFSNLSALCVCIIQLLMHIQQQRRRCNLLRRLLLLRNITPTHQHRRRARPRRFWMRPGRTSSWWDNSENEVVVAEEWRENFWMSRTSLSSLTVSPHEGICPASVRHCCFSGMNFSSLVIG